MIETIKKQSINYLQVVPFSDFYNWSVQYLLENTHSYNEKYELVKIGSFLKRNKTSIDIQDNESYKRVTIKINNGGVFLRDVEKGLNIGTKKQFLISKGQFLLSKIDARNGAFGVVPNEVDGAIITGNFWTFDVDYNKINPYFLSLIVTTPTFLKFSENASNGTTNRHYLQESLFLEQKIPLPTIEEQNKIVAAYQEKIQLAEQQAKQANELEAEIERYLMEELGVEKKDELKIKNSFIKIINYKNFERWDGKTNAIFNSNFQILKIGDCIENIATGTTPSTSRQDYFNGDVNFFTPADLTNEMYLNKSERTVTQLAIEDRKARKFDKGTLLFVGIGSTVGKVGIVNNEFATCNQQITGLQLKSDLLDLEYTYYYFDIFKNITTKEKTQATIPIVNQDKILNIPIPVPTIEKQRQISNHINSIKTQINELNILSTRNKEVAIIEFEKEIFN